MLIASQPQYVLVAQALMQDISNGRFPVGALLPPEMTLCTQFGVSRHTVREAIRRLQERGLITRQRGVGTRVKAQQSESKYVQSASTIPDLLQYAKVDDVAKAAKDWPQLNFIIYHGGYRYSGSGGADGAWAQFEKSGRIDWVSDLADISGKHSVNNVYADVGQLFAQSTIADPRVSAVMMGQLIAGMGADHVCWGTDAIWTGAPQWQIEALRRLEIPEDLQKRYSLKPLGPADGPIKRAIFGDNNARLYNFTPAQRAAVSGDKIASGKAIYDRHGDGRTNMAYGYVNRGVA